MEKILEQIAEKLIGLRCTGIEIVDVAKKTPLTEYYIVATSRSVATLKGAASAVGQVLKENDYPIHHIEYKNGSLWCLIDCTHFIIHLFAPGERQRMNFAENYKNCPIWEYGDDDDELTNEKNNSSKPDEIDTWR